MGDQWCHLCAAHGETGGAVGAVDRTLEIEDLIDPPHHLERQRGDRLGVLTAPRVRGDVGKLEELAPAMGPT